MEYEYAVELVYIKDVDGATDNPTQVLRKALDAWGSQGWRFNGQIPHPETKDLVYLIFERPIR